MKEVAEVLAQVLFFDERGDDEIGLAPLAIGAEEIGRPTALCRDDRNEGSEDSEAVLRHPGILTRTAAASQQLAYPVWWQRCFRAP